MFSAFAEDHAEASLVDVSHHIIESIRFLHSVVWRGVLGDQNKVPHS